VFDPEHEVWEYGPDDWIETRNEAEREIEAAIRHLTETGIFRTEVVRKSGNTPVAIKVEVASEEEIGSE